MGEVTRLIGVYDADGSLFGEMSYVLRRRLGRAHCALCDITHARVLERSDWRACRDQLPVPFVTFHRDDQPDVVRAAASPPAVLAQTARDELVVLLDAAAIEQCAGSPARLVERIQSAVAAHDLAWSSSDG